MKAFLEALQPVLAKDLIIHVRVFEGKHDLLRKLPDRLRAHRRSLRPGQRILVLLDRDRQDCHALKARLEAIARDADLATRSRPGQSGWTVVNRIVVSELEAWYFGDWEAVRAAYPNVPRDIPRKAAFRDPDAIVGGTFAAFERILKRAGYAPDGVRKTALASAIGPHMDPARNTSASFHAFRRAINEMISP